MEIENLKSGDQFYEVVGFNIVKWQFHSVYPLNDAGKNPLNDYYIVLNRTNERPDRIYGKELQRIINENLKTYEEAKQKVKEKLQDRLKNFDKDY